MTHNRKAAEPTCVSRVEQALQRADDFLTAPMIRELAGLDRHHTEVCLWHLTKYQVIDSIRSGDELWWFLTPERDLRARTVALRKKEDTPRKPHTRRRAVPFPLAAHIPPLD